MKVKVFLRSTGPQRECEGQFILVLLQLVSEKQTGTRDVKDKEAVSSFLH